jgi:hypothetical protein
MHFQTNSHTSAIRDRVGITLENDPQFLLQSLESQMRALIIKPWVNGHAGVGKLTLMRKIAELCLVYSGGCFFFRRGVPGCNVKDHLFCTLAYQLAMNVDGMFEAVDRAVMQYFSLPRMSATIQLKRLIIAPIRLLPIPLHPFIITIDGLDECEDFNSHREFLTLIGQVTRFINASRPEHQICDIFNKEPLFSRTHRLVLDEAHDAAADIEQYLRDKIEEIFSRNRDIMLDVQSPWPLANHLRELVRRSSGQFIYASTVLKFLDSDTDLCTPEEKLNTPLVLDEKYHPDDDIRLFLAESFESVKRTHELRFPRDWPTRNDIDHLVCKSSGLFIYAATVVKFLRSSRGRPKEQLDIILGITAAGAATPFAELDALYSQGPVDSKNPKVIILDGLDECGTEEAQQSILKVIADSLPKFPIPLCFLIASRPEKAIRHSFNDQPLLKITFILKPSPMQDSAFSALDRLYTQLFSVYGETKVRLLLRRMTLFSTTLTRMMAPTFDRLNISMQHSVTSLPTKHGQGPPRSL